MPCIHRTKAVADRIVRPALSRIGSIIPIAEGVENMVDRAVEEYHLGDMEEPSTNVVDDEPAIVRSLPRAKRTSKIRSDYELHKEPQCTCRCHCSSSCRKRDETSV